MSGSLRSPGLSTFSSKAVGEQPLPQVDSERSSVVRRRASAKPGLHHVEDLARSVKGWRRETNRVREYAEAMSIRVLSSEAEQFPMMLVEEMDVEGVGREQLNEISGDLLVEEWCVDGERFIVVVEESCHKNHT